MLKRKGFLFFAGCVCLESRNIIRRGRCDIQSFPETQLPLSVCYRSIWSCHSDAEFRSGRQCCLEAIPGTGPTPIDAEIFIKC